MGFDKIKTAYARKRKEAEKNGDDEFLADVGSDFSVFSVFLIASVGM